jgi:acyl-CoA thioester hydrolase
LTIAAIGRTSIQTDYEMRRLHGGELAAKLPAKTVFFNLAERKSIPLTEPMLERLRS